MLTYTLAQTADWENLLELRDVPLWSFNMNNQGVGVTVGMRGNCYLTDDYGRSWAKHYPGTDKILNYAGFTPDGGILVTGYEGTIVYFEKPGIKFEDRSAEPVYNLKNFIFTDDKNGYMISERNYLLKTSDGGKLWEVEKVFREYPFLKGIINIGSTLYVAADNRDTSVIYKSNDEGKNWEIISIFPGESIWNIKNYDGIIWISGSGGLLANSNDGGVNWNWIETKSKKYIIDFEVKGNEIWIMSKWDKDREILNSNNLGKSWKIFDSTEKCDWPGKMKIIGNDIYLVEDYHGKVKKAKINH
jgi:photosystem II stability/assembly factor-like uncharacterized protein